MRILQYEQLSQSAIVHTIHVTYAIITSQAIGVLRLFPKFPLLSIVVYNFVSYRKFVPM